MTKIYDPWRYLHSLKGFGIRPDLVPLSRVLKLFGHPERDYRSVLIAGTNGKGSIAAMVSSILGEAGLRTGLYTSPHLRDYRERIRVNGRMMTRQDLRDLVRAAQKKNYDDLTYFEFTTLLAFLYFSRCHVDVAVLEVGMGGRFDATNVVTPEVSVISNISLEHEEYLGRNLAAIAREKGGIIKKGVTCLTGVRQKKVIGVLEGICREQGARCYRLGADIAFRRLGSGAFSYRGIGRRYGRLEVPLRGRHQIENAALATGVTEVLSTKGFRIDEKAVINGLKKTRWEGRLDILHESPKLIVDGAHNPAGITALRRALGEEFLYRRLILIFGVLKDKNYRAMLKRIAPIADRLILTRPLTDRALPPLDLRAALPEDQRSILVENEPWKALREAFRLAGKEDLICVTGSLYLVGDIKKAFLRGWKH